MIHSEPMKLILALFAILFGVLLGVGVIGFFAVLAAIIPFALYNYGLVPLFHLPQVTFFQTVAVLWALGLIVRTVRSVFHKNEN